MAFLPSGTGTFDVLKFLNSIAIREKETGGTGTFDVLKFEMSDGAKVLYNAEPAHLMY